MPLRSGALCVIALDQSYVRGPRKCRASCSTFEKKNKPILRLKWQRVVNYQTGGENKADAVDDLRQHQI